MISYVKDEEEDQEDSVDSKRQRFHLQMKKHEQR